MPTTLPQNRQLKEIGNICNFQNGFAFKSSLFKEKGLPIIRISNIQKDQISFNRIVYFDINDYNKDLSQYLIKKGDVLIAMSGATTGKLAINQKEEDIYLNQRVGKLTFNDESTKKYVYLYLSTKIEENLNRSVGAAIPNLSSDQIKEIQIPLPPLETQKAIVAKLDEIFANLDQTKSEIQKNIQATDEVWKSSLNKVFEEGDWEMKGLNKLVHFSQGIQVPVGKQFPKKKEGFVRFLRIIDFTQGGQEPRYIENLGERYFVNKDDLSMVRYGATTGFICKGKEGIIANNMFKITPIKDDVSKDYLYIFFKSPIFKIFLQKEVFGAAMPAISFGSLNSIQIPLPPLSKQKDIVAHLDQLSTHTKQLKQKYQSQLDNIEELRKSVLDQAFKGELI